MSKHTPGPWKVVVPKHPLQGFTHAINSPTGAVAWAFPPQEDLSVAEANAHLIAAAPALLANLEFAVWCIENPGMGPTSDALANMKTAIAQAKGAGK